MITKDKAIKYIIKNFDWEKTYNIMKALDWKWRGNDESPSHGELFTLAYTLLNDAFDKAVENRETASVMTGGFKATAQYDNEIEVYRLNLEFILTWWEYDFEDEELDNADF